MEFFKKGDILTADSLNTLAEVLTNAGGCVVPRVAGTVARQACGQPGPAWYNDATAVDATGRSYFDEATQSMVYGPGDCEGLIAGAHWNRQIHELKISDGILHLPLAHVQEHHEIDPEDDTVEYYAGGVEAIDVREGTAATIENGTICLPLARSPEYEADDTTGEEYEVAAGWAGLLASAEFTSGIAAPVLNDGNLQMPLAEYASGVGIGEPTAIAGALAGVEIVPDLTDPEIRNGLLRLPASGGSIAPAEFVGTDPTAIAPGGLQGAEYATGITQPQARHGILQLPLADTGYFGTMVAGGVNGIRYGSGVEPSIYFGEILLPQPTGGGSIEPAEFVGTDPTAIAPGGLQGAEYATGITQPQARHGVLQLPLADTVTHGTMVAGGVNGIRYGSGVEPSIYFGEILLPQSGEPIKGAKGLLAGNRTWAEISAGAGGELDVAGCWVNDTFLTLSLGLNNGFLTFTLSA